MADHPPSSSLSVSLLFSSDRPKLSRSRSLPLVPSPLALPPSSAQSLPSSSLSSIPPPPPPPKSAPPSSNSNPSILGPPPTPPIPNPSLISSDFPPLSRTPLLTTKSPLEIQQKSFPQNHPVSDSPPKSYSSVCSEEPKTLDFQQPELDDDGITIPIPSSSQASGSSAWDDCLLGQFYGDPPKPGFIHSVLNRLWGDKGEIEVMPLGKLGFLFRVPDKGTRRWILRTKLWHVGNSPLFISPWKHGIIPSMPPLTKIPAWISFEDVPLDLFTRDGLGRIASGVGNPLFLDRATELRKRADLAKVSVEIDITKALPGKLKLRFDDGFTHFVHVRYPWLPKLCNSCSSFGHTSDLCPKKVESPSSSILNPPTSSTQTTSSQEVDPLTSKSSPEAPLETSPEPQNSSNPPLQLEPEKTFSPKSAALDLPPPLSSSPSPNPTPPSNTLPESHQPLPAALPSSFNSGPPNQTTSSSPPISPKPPTRQAAINAKSFIHSSINQSKSKSRNKKRNSPKGKGPHRN